MAWVNPDVLSGAWKTNPAFQQPAAPVVGNGVRPNTPQEDEWMRRFEQTLPNQQPAGSSPLSTPLNTGVIGGGWFSQNAPQVQPGGGGFQEQQSGAVPLPNTGVMGGMMSQAGGSPFAGLMRARQFGGGQAMGGMAPYGGQMSPYQMGSQGNVLLRAPDGSTKSVPAGEMQHWLGRGAVRF